MTVSIAPAPLPVSMPTNDAPLLFCPFCRECFEGEKECPEHELALVPFEKLPRDPAEEGSDVPSHEEVLSLLDPRFGRGLVMAGVALSAVGFVMPVMTLTTATQTRVWSGFEAALSRAPNLWTIPFVAAMFVWILARRRTALAMLGARFAGVVFALAPIFSLAYTALKVTQGAAQQSARTGQMLDVSLEYGVVVLAIASLLMLIGSARLGVLPRTESAPPSSPEPVTAKASRSKKR